ncbi:hypothetical protein LCGC14_3074350 [marine sediment metagenome]|uniref:Uncharacterized protein n=1 Tax=marine sediment metagenome TaxID=412755 RepID=A0A0F8WF61_9ZZZZ
MVQGIKKLIKKMRIDKKNQYLFRSGWSSQSEEVPNVSGATSAYWSAANSDGAMNEMDKKDLKDEREDKKPIDVYKEIFSEEPKMDLYDLKQQIKIVKRRRDFLKYELEQQYTDEEEALRFLEARSRYVKYKDLFRWQVTNQAKIDQLCKKYKVRMVDFAGYYKTAPMEAIDELEKFIKAYEKIRKDKPVIKLIIDDGGKETRKDPILLTTSPFGKWYYVLGAWDKEVEIIDDLIYKGK